MKRSGCWAGWLGEPSSHAVRLCLEFSARPTGRNWYRAHNASIVRGYLEHRDLAEAEDPPDRFFINVALVRVLYAHVLVGAPSLALGGWPPSYEWSAQDLDEPRLLELVRDGNPIYAWPFEHRHVWRGSNTPLAARVLERLTRAC